LSDISLQHKSCSAFTVQVCRANTVEELVAQLVVRIKKNSYECVLLIRPVPVKLHALICYDQLKHKYRLEGGVGTFLTLTLIFNIHSIRVESFEAAYLFALAAVELTNLVKIVRLYGYSLEIDPKDLFIR